MTTAVNIGLRLAPSLVMETLAFTALLNRLRTEATWDYFGCTDYNEKDAYRNLLKGQPYNMEASINGVVEMVTNYNPIGVWKTPFDIQFMGETKYLQSNIAGVPSEKQLFPSMGVQQFTTDNLVSTCGNAYLAHFAGTPGRYDEDDVSCSYIRTWTADGQ